MRYVDILDIVLAEDSNSLTGFEAIIADWSKEEYGGSLNEGDPPGKVRSLQNKAPAGCPLELGIQLSVQDTSFASACFIDPLWSFVFC